MPKPGTPLAVAVAHRTTSISDVHPCVCYLVMMNFKPSRFERISIVIKNYQSLYVRILSRSATFDVVYGTKIL